MQCLHLLSAFVAIAILRVSWGSLKACFLLKKIAQDKKMPLRFNYPSWLPLTRKKCTVALSSSVTKIPVLVAFFLPVVNRSLKMNCSSFFFFPPYSQEVLSSAQM